MVPQCISGLPTLARKLFDKRNDLSADGNGVNERPDLGIESIAVHAEVRWNIPQTKEAREYRNGSTGGSHRPR